MYAWESWTLIAQLQRRIQAMERCYHKILCISYKDHVTNEEVCAKIQLAIRPHEDLLTIVKRHKIAVVWACLPFIRSGQNHLARRSERGKKTRRTKEEVGRQHQEMDRLEFTKSQRAVENRKKWRELFCEIICDAPATLAVKG